MKTLLLSTLFILFTCSIVLGQGNFTLEYTSPGGEDYIKIHNTERNNNIPEIFTGIGEPYMGYTSYKIYDGATHILKRTFNVPPDSSNFIFGFEEFESIMNADINNDGVYEILLIKSTQYGNAYLKVLNGSNGDVLFTYAPSSGIRINNGTFKDIDNDGYLELLINEYTTSSYLKTLKVFSTPATVSINNNSIQVPNYELKQNYPNPFNPSTTIEYSIKKTADVQIKIYDISGREIQSVAKGVQAHGTYKVNLTLDNLSSGTYFYQILVDGISEAKKMILIK